MNLKQFRKSNNITQEELSELIGVHENTIRLWEKGLREPRSSDIQKLCEILHCTEAELLNGSDNGRIKVTLSYNWEDFKKGEINMDIEKFDVILSDSGMVGINGAMRVSSRSMIDDVLAKIRSELEFGFDSQERRGIIQET